MFEISRFVLFLAKKTQKRNDAPSWKNRYILWKLSFYYKRFSLKLCLKSHVLLYFWRKKHTKNTMHVAEKNVTFCENCRSIIRGFHWNYVWNLTFCSIFGEKKHAKNTMHLAEKTVPFCENCRYIIRGFHWNYVGNLTFCSIFGKKHTNTHTQKHDAPSWKNRYVLWKLSFYHKRFSLNYVWNLMFCYFWRKNAQKTRCT